MSLPLVTRDVKKQGRSRRISQRGDSFEPNHNEQGEKHVEWISFGRRRGLILGVQLTSPRSSHATKRRCRAGSRNSITVRHPAISVSDMLRPGNQSSCRKSNPPHGPAGADREGQWSGDALSRVDATWREVSHCSVDSIEGLEWNATCQVDRKVRKRRQNASALTREGGARRRTRVVWPIC